MSVKPCSSYSIKLLHKTLEDIEHILHKDKHTSLDITMLRSILCDTLNKTNDKFTATVIFSILQKLTQIPPSRLYFLSNDIIQEYSKILFDSYNYTYILEIVH
jgi:hypothetical protein